MTTHLQLVRQLDPYRTKLKPLGLDSLEAFVSVATASPLALSNYLGVPVEQLLKGIDLPTFQLSAEQTAALSVSCPLDQETASRPSASFDSTTLPAPADAPPVGNVNLIAQMPPIRGQGTRNTCVAFASLAAYEHLLGVSGNPVLLSEQYLYCKCKSTDGHYSTGGSSIFFAFLALHNFGCCPLQEWPYNPNQDPSNEGQCPPPDGADADAATYRLAAPVSIPPRAVGLYRNYLSADRCVAFGFPVFNSSVSNPQARLTGSFVNPIPGEPFVGNHALCAVGYADMPDRADLGGGLFLVRNSWWPGWATQSPIAPGYGTISYYYVANYAAQACAIGAV